ncbi:MAG: outer membrane beta-barrel protein [Gammaproteobacteria bacterium]
MNTSTLITATSLLLVTLLPAPVLAGADSGFYVGAGVGRVSIGDIDIDHTSFNFNGDDTAYKLFAGFNFGVIPLLDLAVEGGYVNFGTPHDNGLKIDADGFDLFGLVGTNLGPIGIFGKAGAINWDAKASSVLASSSDSGTDPAYGVGLRFQLGSFQVRGEYEMFDISAADNVFLLSASAVYTF